MPSTTIDTARLAAAIEKWVADPDNLLSHLEFESGVDTRIIYAIRKGRAAEFDTIDRLCLALQLPLSEVLPMAHPIAANDAEGWCHGCNEMVGINATLRCPWCDHQVRAGGRRGKRIEDDLTCISAALLRDAYAMYASGLALRRVAERVHPFTTYANPDGCYQAIYKAWLTRGWKLRCHAEAVANRTTNPCAGVRADGRPCGNGRLQGGDHCKIHDPARREALLANVAAMRAKRAAKLTHTAAEIRERVDPWLAGQDREAMSRLADWAGVNRITLRTILRHSEPDRPVEHDRAVAILAAIERHAPDPLVDTAVVIEALRPWRETRPYGALRVLADEAGYSYPTVQKRLYKPERPMPRSMADRLLCVLDEDARSAALESATTTYNAQEAVA